MHPYNHHCFQQSYCWLNEISREPSELSHLVLQPKSLEKLCHSKPVTSHQEYQTEVRSWLWNASRSSKIEVANLSFTWISFFLVASYCIILRLHKEGFSFQIWVTCLQATAITNPQTENMLSSKYILAWPRKTKQKTTSLAVQKGLLISPEILRRRLDGLEQLSSFQVAQSKVKG